MKNSGGSVKITQSIASQMVRGLTGSKPTSRDTDPCSDTSEDISEYTMRSNDPKLDVMFFVALACWTLGQLYLRLYAQVPR